MKSLKKFTAIFISIVMILSTSIHSFALEEQASNYEFLLSQGYPAEYLDNLTESSLQKMVEIIGTGYIANIEIEESTLNESTGTARGAINEGSMTLQIVTATICQHNTNKITGVLVSAAWDWAKNKPIYRGQDAVTVNWDNSIFSYNSDSFYAQDYYKSDASDNWSIFKEYTTLATSNQGGIGHWTDLKGLKRYVGGAMVFLLNPNSPMINGTTYNTTINVEYAHAPVPLTGLSLSILDVGVGISWNLTCDTMADSCNFNFSR